MGKNLLIIFSIISNFILAQNAVTPSGDGTEVSPYQIGTWENLYWISQNSSSWNAHFEQTADIDLGTATPPIENWDNGAGWSPIGNEASHFKGNYNGMEFDISGLFIERASSNNIGLFGYVGYDDDGVVIENVRLTEVNISGARNTGALIGRISGFNNTIVSGSYVKNGTVSGDGATGGLIGVISSTVTNPSNNDHHPVVIECNSDVNVIWSGKPESGADLFGGFAGTNRKGRIINCYSSSTVSVDNESPVSLNNTEEVVPSSIGGFIGSMDIRGIVDKSFSAGNILIIGNAVKIGGFCGDGGSGGRHGSTIDCFWDVDAAGYDYSSSTNGCTGKTSAEMKIPETYIDAGWDFFGEGSNGSEETWNIYASVNEGYPFLRREFPFIAPLPVELVSFTATPKINSVELKWETATEIDNYGFSIERSSEWKNGRVDKWKEIGFVTGHGNSNSQKFYSFRDENPLAGISLYRLKQIDNDGQYDYSDVLQVKVETNIPTEFLLSQNYPNPFNPITKIKYNMPINVEMMPAAAGKHAPSLQTKLVVFDILGNHVSTLVNEVKQPGTYEVEFDASDLPSGIYFYKLEVNGKMSASKKMMLLK